MAKNLDEPRNTINDKNWGSLQDRARKANPEPSIFDKKATERRKAANENFKNRSKN